MEQLQFCDMMPFLSREEIGSPATTSKLIGILSNQGKSVYLQIELAAVVDAGRNFVKSTYKLEGDVPLALSCFQVIKEIEVSMHISHNPNVDALIRKLGSSTRHAEAQLRVYAEKYIQPGFDNLIRQISTNLQEAVAIFKAA